MRGTEIDHYNGFSLEATCPRRWLTSGLTISLLGSVFLFGCNTSNPTKSSKSNEPTSDAPLGLATFPSSKTVSAQGRLQPKDGIVRLVALPGDKVEAVLVAVGDQVSKGQKLLQLESEHARKLELEVAKAKLREGELLAESRTREADTAVKAAELNLARAKQQLEQSQSSRELAKTEKSNSDQLNSHINLLQRLRDDPVTRAAIGGLEIESKKSELSILTSRMKQNDLAGDQAVELASLQVQQAGELLQSSLSNQAAAKSNASLETLQKQIALLEFQLEQSVIKAPSSGRVLNVNAAVGERTSQMPLVEIADLSEIVCAAEVHEADVAKIAVGDAAELRSAALKHTLHGKVERIERIVGNTQLRSPNPLSRSDFRSVQVWIAIVDEHAEEAAKLLQLQVDVAITLSR